VDLSRAANPYDFAHPVPDAKQFIGRKPELEDIKYYLDQGKVVPHPISLALLGPRASGKTSVLNVVEAEAMARGYLAVRIDLDEGDVKSDFGFFFKVFDAVVMATFLSGGFGGITAKTYDTYVDIVYSNEIPDDKTFCPFLLPLQYAKAKGRVSSVQSVSDSSLKHDLTLIRQHLNAPLILLFDECNVLAHSRVILEKLRNLFMNMSGYMLVLTGTPDLFPLIDEVFSPIVRQFKKIPIGAFSNLIETEDCIRRPLKELDAEILVDRTLVAEIQELTGGRPYEIKLVCHFLFRRIQEGSADKMNLDTGVLEAVKRELETSQDVLARPALRKIRSLGLRDLLGLSLLCPCDGGVTFEDAWAISHVFKLSEGWSRDELNALREAFLASGLLVEKAGKLSFVGDDFDRIYSRFFAKERDVSIFQAQSVLEWISHAISAFVKPHQGAKVVAREASISDANEFETVARQLSGELKGDVFQGHDSLALQLYFDMGNHGSGTQIPVLCIETGIPSFLARSWIYAAEPSGLGAMPLVQEALAACSYRATEVGYPFSFYGFVISVPSVSVRARAVAESPNKTLASVIWTTHWAGCLTAYLIDNLPLAREQREAARILSPAILAEFSDKMIVNSGYMSFALGDASTAEEEFIRALGGPNAALAHYDLAMVLISEGRLRESQKHLLSAISLVESAKTAENCIRLFFPEETEGRLIVKEKKGSIELREFASRAEEVVRLFLNSRDSEPRFPAGATGK